MPGYTGVLSYVYDFQTLITGAAALVAAGIATRYSRRQMRLMTREMLVSRGKALALRRKETAALFHKVQSMRRHLRPWENETVEPNAHWAHQAESDADDIISTLREYQDASLDGKTIDVSREKLLDSCNRLSTCLFHIHAIASLDFGGFEEPSESEKPDYEARAATARGQIVDRLDDVLKCAKSLDAAFDGRLTEIRRELRGLERVALRR